MEPMSTQTEQTVPGDETQVEQAAPEQKLEVAPQDEPKEDEVSNPEEDKLSDSEKTFKRLQRRIERLSGKVGATARERDMLRDQLATFQKGEETQPEQDLEARASAKAHEILATQKLKERADATLKAGKALEGFNEALETLREEIPFVDDKRRPTPFFEALLDADNPAKLIHYLGANPEEAAEFENLTPSQIGRRLAKIELKLDVKDKTSNAPTPLTPVKGSNTVKTPDAMTDKEFAAWRRGQIRARG